MLTFEKIGIHAAAGIINFVVLTAALSSCNSGIFSTSRMLFNLAEQKEAPPSFAKLTKRGIPGVALIVTALAMLVGVYLNYVSEKAFQWVTSIATFGAIWTWAIILLSQLQFRKRLSPEKRQQLTYKMPLYPYSSYISLAFLILVAILMGYFKDTRIALIIGPAWLILLVVVYYAKGLHKRHSYASDKKQVSKTTAPSLFQDGDFYFFPPSLACHFFFLICYIFLSSSNSYCSTFHKLFNNG